VKKIYGAYLEYSSRHITLILILIIFYVGFNIDFIENVLLRNNNNFDISCFLRYNKYLLVYHDNEN